MCKLIIPLENRLKLKEWKIRGKSGTRGMQWIKRNIDLSGFLKGKERQYGVKVILETWWEFSKYDSGYHATG